MTIFGDGGGFYACVRLWPLARLQYSIEYTYIVHRIHSSYGVCKAHQRLPICLRFHMKTLWSVKCLWCMEMDQQWNLGQKKILVVDSLVSGWQINNLCKWSQSSSKMKSIKYHPNIDIWIAEHVDILIFGNRDKWLEVSLNISSFDLPQWCLSRLGRQWMDRIDLRSISPHKFDDFTKQTVPFPLYSICVWIKCGSVYNQFIQCFHSYWNGSKISNKINYKWNGIVQMWVLRQQYQIHNIITIMRPYVVIPYNLFECICDDIRLSFFFCCWVFDFLTTHKNKKGDGNSQHNHIVCSNRRTS